MPTLTQAAKKRILYFFEQSHLSKELFEFRFNQKDIIIDIRYKPNKDFNITIAEENKKLISTESPGITLLEQQIFDLRSPNEIESKVRDWIRRIEEEIILENNSAEVTAKFRKEFDEALKNLDKPNEPLDKNEADDWEKKFAVMIENIDKVKKDLKLQEHDIKELKQEIDNMKTVSTKMPRSIWIKSVGHKIFNWMDKKLELAMVTAIETTVKTALSGPK